MLVCNGSRCCQRYALTDVDRRWGWLALFRHWPAATRGMMRDVFDLIEDPPAGVYRLKGAIEMRDRRATPTFAVNLALASMRRCVPAPDRRSWPTQTACGDIVATASDAPMSDPHSDYADERLDSAMISAPVAQGIEHGSPKPVSQVRILPGHCPVYVWRRLMPDGVSADGLHLLRLIHDTP
jgi:hypothetical protein